MLSAWSLDVASATDRGRVRARNEDSIAVRGELGCAVLADGMGGCNAGDVASRLAVETLSAGLYDLVRQVDAAWSPAQLEQAMAREVQAANEAICAAARQELHHAGMGTTVVAAVWRGKGVVVAHLGDSRAYRYRANVLEQLTHDHSLAQERIDAGVVADDRAIGAFGRSVVTRALGSSPQVEVEVHTHEARPGDLYLLCSDGLFDMVDERAMAATLGSGGSLAGMAGMLVQQANDRGGRDNVSVILVRLHPRAPEARNTK